MKRPVVQLFVLLLVVGCLSSVNSALAQNGTLKGRFVFGGDPPKPKELMSEKIAQDFPGVKIYEEQLVVDAKGGIKNIFVYVRSKDVKVTPEAMKDLPESVTIDNKEGRFEPRCLSIWFDKQKLIITNSDNVGHNSNIQPPSDKGTNPLIPGMGKAEYKFGRKQNWPVPVGCNIHPWMQGHILAIPHPYAAVTSATGEFEIKNLPPGKLEFQVWHELPAALAAKKEWAKGRFELEIKKGDNDLGEIKVDPKLLVTGAPAKAAARPAPQNDALGR